MHLALRIPRAIGTLGLLACVVAAAAPAAAQNPHCWVSGVGDDTNPCSRTAPCKSFAGAFAKVATGGEIAALDLGTFGPVTITKPVSIRGDGFISGVVVNGFNAIVIQVPNATDTVILRGLDIEGLGTSPNGILVTQGGNVFVEDSTINNFTTAGINFATSADGSSLHVRNTLIRNNGGLGVGGGILIGSFAAATADLDRVQLNHNWSGLVVSSAASARVAVTDSVAADNTVAGFSNVGAGAVLNVERSLAAHNGVGVACGGSTTRIGNLSLVDNGTPASGFVCSSFKNNDVDVFAGFLFPIFPQ
jgi:hypothetical protein